MSKVSIWTDGSCAPTNPGPGGWGVVLEAKVSGNIIRKELSGGKSYATNNEMELLAVEEALKALRGAGHKVTIYTDSRLVVGYMAWGWKCNKSTLRKIVGRIATRVSIGKHSVKYVKVKGHDGNPNNERADALAKQGRERLLQEAVPA